MKKWITLVILFIFSTGLIGCRQVITDLREKYPAFFDVEADGGLTV